MTKPFKIAGVAAATLAAFAIAPNAFARHGADDPAGHVRQEDRQADRATEVRQEDRRADRATEVRQEDRRADRATEVRQEDRRADRANEVRHGGDDGSGHR